MLEDQAAPSSPPVMPNPLREGLAEERMPEPAVMVIFGASGDLAHRKLLPALYSLTRDRLLLQLRAPALVARDGHRGQPPVARGYETRMT
jgi:Glucose-6-phosphate dehydrogenase, NAD binding domain